MKTYNRIVSLLGLLLLAIVGHAQPGAAGEKAQFKFGAYYNNHLNYYGRTDSLRSSGLFPVAELWFNKNLYINAAPVFTNNKVAGFQYAGSVLTAGYQFNSDEKIAGNFYFVKPLYKSNSELVQSALKAQFSSTLSFLNKFLNMTGGADVKFSDKVDYGATAGIDHIFRIDLPDQAVLVVDPSAFLNAGTQQFTKTYYKQSSFLFFPGANQTVTEEVSKFNILSYEFSAPVILAKDKFQFIFTPAYTIPQNLVTVANRPDLSERGKAMFYATVGAKVIF
jgi:hypothetical protein